MTRVYRILRRPYAKTPLDGEGSYRFGGRWSSAGTRVTYASQHVSLAMLEYFVHIDADDPPKDLVLVTAEIPDSVPRLSVAAKQLPRGWRRTPAPQVLAEIGDEFVRRGRATILMVPSVLAPTEMNWLLNPMHVGFGKIRVTTIEKFGYDARFFD